jgi:CRISPR-associated protein Csb2
MLVITAELLHGSFRASSTDLALAGAGDAGEWPPSVARLHAAFVAADGTRDRCRVTTGTELEYLEALPPPHIIASPRRDLQLNQVAERFVVANNSTKGTVQEYPGRTARAARASARVHPRDPKVTYVWPDATPSTEILTALATRAARIGYLGCSDSPARVRVSSATPPEGPTWTPAADGDATTAVPFDGSTAVLDAAYDQWMQNAPVRRSWFRTERQPYRSPEWAGSDDGPSPTTVWLELSQALRARDTVRVTETLKAAVLEHYSRLVGGPDHVPALIHGHQEGLGYQSAHWIALPDVGRRHATGAIRTVGIVLPPDTEADVVETTRAAMAALGDERLVAPGLFDVEVTPWSGEALRSNRNPDRWVGPAVTWVAALPVLHERRTKRGPDLDEVGRWCEHAGLPRPISFADSPVPLLEGSPPPNGLRIARRREDNRPRSYLSLRFAEAVAGPVVLGRARQYGMGLMRPVERGAS